MNRALGPGAWLALCLCGAAEAQTLQRVVDLNSVNGGQPTVPTLEWFQNGTSYELPPQQLGPPIAGKIPIAGKSPTTGTELWLTDGTNAGTVLVKDIRPGPLSSTPRDFVAVGTKWFFAADDGVNGEELWVTDGTPGGTSLAKDIAPGPGGSAITQLAAVGSLAFFEANDGSHGAEPWKSDGTAAGTVLVQDMIGGTASSTPRFFVEAMGATFFGYNPFFTPRRIGKYDGISVTNYATTITDNGPLVPAFGQLIFAGSAPTGGIELYRTDGTTGGTQLIFDLNPGDANANPSVLTPFGSALYFTASGKNPVAPFQDTGPELWRLDGAYSTPVLVKEFIAGTTGPTIVSMTAAGSQLFFVAHTSTEGYELYRTDGTGPGTFLVRDLNPGSSSGVGTTGFFVNVSHPLTALGNSVVFMGNDGVNGAEPWVSDGTSLGTVMLADVATGAASGGLFGARALGPTVVFASSRGAGTDVSGAELWKTDGTPAGTTRFRTGGPTSSDPSSFVALGTQLLFRATNGVSGQEPWVTDGTALGTRQVADVRPGPETGGFSRAVSLGSEVVFAGFRPDSGLELWRTDGTDAGTRQIRDVAAGAANANPVEVCAFKGAVWLQLNDGAFGPELWRYPAPDGGIALAIDTTPGAFGGNPHDLAATSNALYFSAGRTGMGIELFHTDGTPGSFVVRDLRPGAADSNPDSLVAMNDAVYFSANDGVTGRELWRSDGTDAGTFLVADIADGGADALALNDRIIAAGSNVFFIADDGIAGRELWRSDGTRAGTFITRDITPGSAGTSFGGFAAVGSQVVFAARTASEGIELWTSDGTSAGTQLLFDINPGAASSNPSNLSTVGASVYFSADDGVHGTEPWVTDGTAAGTVLVTDIAAGLASSSPGPALGVGGNIYLAASDATMDRELYKMAADTTPPVITPNISGTLVNGFYRSNVTVTFSVTDPETAATPGAGCSTTYSFTTDGVFTASCTAASAGGIITRTVTIRRDTTAPTITCSNQTFEAQSAAGAVVVISQPTTDLQDSSPVITSSPPSGGTFPMGPTTVTATSTDKAGNSASCTFVLTVRDTSGPRLTCPETRVVEATSPNGTPVTFTPVSIDLVDPSPSLVATPASGTLFALGPRDVSVVSKDALGNTSTCTFRVLVVDTTGPTIECAPSVLEARSSAGAPFEALPRVSDNADPTPVLRATPSPGQWLPPGITPITLVASDATGNRSTCRYDVSVKDTTPPMVTCPESLHAWSRDGMPVALTYEVNATDSVDPRPKITVTPAASVRFAVGTTSVTAVATDASRNHATCHFDVVVEQGVPPVENVTPPRGCGCAGTPGGPFVLAMLVALGASARRRRSLR